MANLKQLNQSFVLIGEAMIPKDLEKYTKTVPSGNNGWMKKTINFGVKITDQNKIYVNQEAGYWSDEIVEKTKNEVGNGSNGKPKKKENFIYNGENVKQDDGTTKYIADNIPFADRFLQENIDKVGYNKKIRVSLEPEYVISIDDEGREVRQVKKDDKGNIVYQQKEFLFIGDAIDYIKTHLSNGQRVYIYGKEEINQYINSKTNKLVTVTNRRINQIRVAREDEENEATGTINFLFEKDSFDKSDFKNTKKYTIQGYRTYKNDEGVVVPIPTNYTLDFSNPNVDWEDEEIKERVSYLTEVFTEGVKRDKVYQTQWRVKLFEGNEEIELTEKDLSKDLQKRVKLGFISKEDAIKQMRSGSIGDKIKEIKLVMPLGEEDKVETDYELDDLIPPSIDDKIAKIAEKKEEKKAEETKKVEDITKKFDSMFA